MTTDSIAELKTLVTDIKDNMMSEKNCNDQLFTIIQTLDGIGNYMAQLEQGGAPQSEGYAVLQTNILEVRNELAKLNQIIAGTNLAELEPVVEKLSEKVNRLDIIANNSGIDKQVLVNISSQLEENLVNKINENSEVLYNQVNTSSNLIKTDMETLNNNLKDGVKHLEKILENNVGSADGSNLQSLSEDMLLLSNNIQKSNENLKRSVIDIFTRIQENLGTASVATSTASGGSVNVDALVQNLEMLKNGLYNVNVNANQQYSKMLQVISEIETYKNLAKFAELKSLPAVGQLKSVLYSKVSELVSSLVADSVDINEPNTLVESVANGVYDEFVAILENVSDSSEIKREEESNEILSRLDMLLPYTKESVADIKDLLSGLKKSVSYMQSGEENSDYTYSMQDIESDVAKIRIYLNELGQHINHLAQNNATDELNNIYLTLDSINQKVSKNENFQMTDNIKKMQEDILSISTRVNTLLLSSDKDSETLNSSLEDFNQSFQEINKELKSESKLKQIDNIESSLDRVSAMLQENKSYSELINQSLVMLAEWVDTAGESITNISAKLGDGIESIVIPQSVDYSDKIAALEMKIVEQNNQIMQQQAYIRTIDEKLSMVLAQSQQISLQDEKLKLMDEKMTNILEFSAKNDPSLVMEKMSNIDTKLEKLGNSIGKLTSYVDEE